MIIAYAWISNPTHSKIARLCQNIEINNNKHVYRQSQGRKPTGSKVEWADCSLIIGTGYWGQVFNLICLLDQFARDSAPETLGSNLAFSRGRQLVSFRLENRLPMPEHRNQQQNTNEYWHSSAACGEICMHYEMMSNYNLTIARGQCAPSRLLSSATLCRAPPRRSTRLHWFDLSLSFWGHFCLLVDCQVSSTAMPCSGAFKPLIILCPMPLTH